MRVAWLLSFAMAGCQAAPSPPAATYALEVNACVQLYDAQALVDSCRAQARAKLCDAEPAVCNDGGAQ